MKILAVIKKNYDFIELESIIEFYNPDHLHFFSYTEKNNTRLHEFSKNVLNSISEKFKNKVVNLEKDFLYIDEVSSGKDIYNIMLPFIEDDTVVVLPLANGRFFVSSVKFFSKNPKVTVCHISDGILDFIPRHKYFFIKNKFTYSSIFNYIISTIRLRNNLAEISFSFFSNYSAFSNKTIKISPNRSFSGKAEKIINEYIPKIGKEKNGILLIPTQGISAELLIKHFSLEALNERFIISSKTGEVILDDKKFWFGSPLSAEEFLHTDCISEVYGGPSTAAFYAKVLNCNTKVTILSSHDEQKIIGFNMENWLRKQCIRYQIKYAYLGSRELLKAQKNQ